MAKDDYLKLKYLKDRSKKLNLKFSLPRDAKNNLQFVFRKNFGKKIVVCLIFLIFEKKHFSNKTEHSCSQQFVRNFLDMTHFSGGGKYLKLPTNYERFLQLFYFRITCF